MIAAAATKGKKGRSNEMHEAPVRERERERESHDGKRVTSGARFTLCPPSVISSFRSSSCDSQCQQGFLPSFPVTSRFLSHHVSLSFSSTSESLEGHVIHLS